MEADDNVSEDGVLAAILLPTRSKTLDDALFVLHQSSKDARGRLDLGSRAVIPSLLELLGFLCQDLDSCFPRILSIVRIIRNLCAGEASNISIFVKSRGIPTIYNLFKSVNFDEQVVCAGMQLLANIILTGSQWHLDVWRHLSPEQLQELSRIHSKAVCFLCCRICYAIGREDNNLLQEMGGDHGVKLVSEIIRTYSEGGLEGDYLPWLLSKICYRGTFFTQLFVQLEASNGDVYFTREQIFLLDLLSKIHEESVSSDFAISVFQIFKKASTVIACLLSRDSSVCSPIVECIEYTSIILRDICASDAQDRRDICASDAQDRSMGDLSAVDTLLSSGILSFLLDLLQDLGPPHIIQKCSFRESDKIKAYCPYKGYRADIVSIIANCAFRRTEVQDQIRQQNGIPLLLQQCVIDEDNPFLREKGLWALRNLLEGNIENQREVAEFRYVGTVDSPTIDGLRLRIDVDQESGQTKLVNIS